MLERTAGCLESGSLRRLLPVSKKSLKSRRTLHSSFWSHGASDLEISPLWTALVRMADPVDQQRGDESPRQRSLVGQTGVLLDFLYPAGTVNFLRQYSGWGIDRQGGRLAKAGAERLGYRQYTSFAKDSSSNMTEPASEAEADGVNTKINAGDESMELLYDRLGLKRSYDYEESWRKYTLVEINDELPSIQRQLMRYLSSSDRIVDSERTIELFELLNFEQRTPATYRHTIRSFLKLRDLANAMELHAKALETQNIPAGSDELLAYLIKNSSWVRAFSIWNQVNEFRARSEKKLSYNMFEVLDTDPNLAGQALDLSEYVNRRIANSSPDDPGNSEELVRFASKIVRRALMSTRTFSPSRFMGLLMTLEKWNKATPAIYNNAIHMLVRLNETKLAVKCYRNARQYRDARFTLPTLHMVLKICCDNHSIIGMQQVLDDFFRMHSRPSRMAYGMCMSEFAAQGDARTVHALFNQLCERDTRGNRSIINVDEIAPVLHVHAKRGEVKEVVSWFHQIKNVYGFEPNLKCWNILINAHGKVQDTDRAYECFEKLLNDNKLRPDDYTFGTMMSICAARGDVDRVIGLYKFAEELKVERSCAMIDCLVLAHIKDGDLQKAESICEEALKMKLKGSRTRMWNSLLAAYAMLRDLNTVNRLLQRMSHSGIDYDQYTYSALMQALAAVKQPERAYEILKQVMPKAGIKATHFHYAIVMGGFLVTNEVNKVLEIQKRMLGRNVKASASTKLLSLKAQVVGDQRLMEEGSEQEMLDRALATFQQIVASIDPQDVSDPARKAVGRAPLDVAYLSMFYRYIILVLGRYSQFSTVNELYKGFMNCLPERRQGQPPLEILYPLMEAKFVERDYGAIQEYWDLALAEAYRVGAPIVASVNVPETYSTKARTRTILPARQLDLARHLSIYLQSLHVQHLSGAMTTTVDGLLNDGFILDNYNWNLYITLLAQRQNYKLSFELCEKHLMDNWTGWARIRWTLPERNRLPSELRNLKKQPTHYRPKYITLLHLARGYLELQSMAAESTASQLVLDDLERECPRVVRAITTMQRVDDNIERTVLRGY